MSIFLNPSFFVRLKRRIIQNPAVLYSVRAIASSSSISNSTEDNSVVFLRARDFSNRIALVDTSGSYSYDRLFQSSQNIGNEILKRTGTRDLKGCCIPFLCPNNFWYVATQWAIWRNGGISVPLSPSQPINLLRHVVEHCNAHMIICPSEYSSKLETLAKEKEVDLMILSDVTHNQCLGAADSIRELTAVEESENCWEKRDAMVVYTSGTTGRPKGVLTTHGNLRSQISSLVKAWEWKEDDYIIHCLPLHHVHGIVNVLLCALWVGATCHMMPKFSPQKVWDILTGDDPRPSLFMAVPTMYSKLIQHFDEANFSEHEKERMRTKCQQLRLMVSGSSALPGPVMGRWQDITGIESSMSELFLRTLGHVLLERYGMTEIGMALSNPLHGPRLSGCVGTPLPGTEVRIVSQNEEGTNEVVVKGNEHSSEVVPNTKGKEGELQVRGPSVFKCYWNNPQATAESFTEDLWFKTGDTAGYKDGVYSILGRTSVDIIKSGGYKISALEVERHLLSHHDIIDCAVVGKPDPVWGERVAAVVTVRRGKELSLTDLREWASGHMTTYQVPSVLLVVDELPRNTMGKVNKKELLKLYFDGG